jgi:hypothetical protein
MNVIDFKIKGFKVGKYSQQSRKKVTVKLNLKSNQS